jgi:hypothetical protein
MKKSIIYTLVLIGLAIISRLIPHWPNLTAVTAVAFTGGLLFGKRLIALVIPFLAIFLSDLVLNNTVYYNGSFTFYTEGLGYIYAAYLLVALLGVLNFGKNKALHVTIGGLSGAILFFLITNFGSWMVQPMYTPDLTGLMSSYIAGVPFLVNQILGTMVYGMVIFGIYRLVETNTSFVESTS